MGRTRIALFTLALLACLVGAATTRAQPEATPSDALSRALAAYSAGDLESAEAGFAAVLEQPRRPLAESLEAHRHLMALRAADGALDEAREHARAAVAIDPRVTPPDGSPSEAIALIRASRLERDRFLQIEAPYDAAAGSTVRAYSRVPPEELGAALHLQCGETVQSTAEVSVALVLPELEAASVDCHASMNALLGGPAFLRSRRTIAFEIAPVRDETADDTGLVWGLIGGGIGLAILGLTIGIAVALASEPSSTPDP